MESKATQLHRPPNPALFTLKGIVQHSANEAHHLTESVFPQNTHHTFVVLEGVPWFYS